MKLKGKAHLEAKGVRAELVEGTDTEAGGGPELILVEGFGDGEERGVDFRGLLSGLGADVCGSRALDLCPEVGEKRAIGYECRRRMSVNWNWKRRRGTKRRKKSHFFIVLSTYSLCLASDRASLSLPLFCLYYYQLLCALFFFGQFFFVYLGFLFFLVRGGGIWGVGKGKCGTNAQSLWYYKAADNHFCYASCQCLGGGCSGSSPLR